MPFSLEFPCYVCLAAMLFFKVLLITLVLGQWKLKPKIFLDAFLVLQFPSRASGNSVTQLQDFLSSGFLYKLYCGLASISIRCALGKGTKD